MSADRLYHYSLIRYVPRPESGEFVNFGVVVVSKDGGDVAVEVTSNWHRARTLGRADHVAFLQKFAKDWKRRMRSPAEQLIEANMRFTNEWLDMVYARAANIVQLTAPRPALAKN